MPATRQALSRMDTRADRIQRQLTDRDGHSTHTLITDAENGLVVRDDNHPGIRALR